jgi:glycosyltransferase involved in cell wall biosynthesis
MAPELAVPNNVELSVVVPMFNEERNIEQFFEVLLGVMDLLGITYEIICINDGSIDQTLEKLLSYHNSNNRIKIINLSRNFGKEAALTAGLRYASGRAVVPIDADLQDPPELIKTFIEEWRKGVDVVYAVRTKRRGDSLAKRCTANMFYGVINFFSKTPIPKNTGDFRLLDRRVVEVINRLPERTRFMKGLFAWVGFKQVAVHYDREPRYAGKTKWNYWKLWNYALDGITLFSTSALKFWSYVGMVISLLAFLYGGYLVSRTLIYGKDVPGYASIMVSILFLGGLQLVSLGIIGEYLGRVYSEVKKRPLYIVSEVYGIEEANQGRAESEELQ